MPNRYCTAWHWWVGCYPYYSNFFSLVFNDNKLAVGRRMWRHRLRDVMHPIVSYFSVTLDDVPSDIDTQLLWLKCFPHSAQQPALAATSARRHRPSDVSVPHGLVAPRTGWERSRGAQRALVGKTAVGLGCGQIKRRENGGFLLSKKISRGGVRWQSKCLGRGKKRDKRKMEDEVELKEGGPGCTV